MVRGGDCRCRVWRRLAGNRAKVEGRVLDQPLGEAWQMDQQGS